MAEQQAPSIVVGVDVSCWEERDVEDYCEAVSRGLAKRFKMPQEWLELEPTPRASKKQKTGGDQDAPSKPKTAGCPEGNA